MRINSLVILAAFALMLSACNQQPPGGSNVAKTDSTTAETKTATSSQSSQPSADVDDVLRKFADFYRQKKNFHVDYAQQMNMEFNGMKNSMESKADMQIERPNLIAIRQRDAALGPDIVCDGKELSIGLGPLKQYFQSPAPESFDELLTNPMVMGGMGGRGPMLDLFSNDPAKALMENVTKKSYVGREKVGDLATDHLKCEQTEFDWEIWIAAEGDPLLVQATFDMSKSLAAAGQDNEQFKNAKMKVVQQYQNWKFDAPAADAFTFVPPEGWKKVDNLMGGGSEEEEEISPLVGKLAPNVEQKLLDGEQFSLKELKDKKIVILDFWATWCGPCVQEMPIIARIAEEYRDKDVALFCVNQQEEPDKIRAFLKKKDLNVTVSLDEGAAAKDYGVEGIPMLVVIDKAGIVQSVHVGFSPGIGKKLSTELDAILSGKDLAAEAIARNSEAADVPAEGLEQAWTKPGRYSSVAVTADRKTIVALNGPAADYYDTSGNQTRSVALEAGGSDLRCSNLTGSESGELLIFGVWSAPLTAVNSEGAKLWSESAAIDDVWAADLDGDGKDEVIVGYNGRVGLHVFGGDGKLRWKDESIANVWHVTAGDLNGDGTMEVVTTSAVGKIHVFDAKGSVLDTFDPGIYANMVRVFRLSGESSDSVIAIGGSLNGTSMVALNGKGEELWKTELPTGAEHCESLAVAAGSPWAAASFLSGLMCVIDVKTGKKIAELSKLGSTAHVAWSTADEKPLLLVTTPRGLTAWHIKPSE